MQLVLPVTSKTFASGDTRTTHKSLSTTVEKAQTIQKVKLVLTGASKSDETLVLLFDDATNSYNEHYDAFKLFGGDSTSPAIFSEMNGIDYFAKAVAGPVSSPVIVPLTITLKEAGSYTINTTEFDNLESYKVVLKHGGIETNLNKNASYTFKAGAGTYSDFALIIGGTQNAKNTDNPFSNDLKTWYSNNFMYINIPGSISSGNGSIMIYDFLGKPVYNNRNLGVVSGQTIQIPVNLKKGYYLTDVVFNSIHYKSKMVVY
jgi:hypothetical protein